MNRISVIAILPKLEDAKDWQEVNEIIQQLKTCREKGYIAIIQRESYLEISSIAEAISDAFEGIAMDISMDVPKLDEPSWLIDQGDAMLSHAYSLTATTPEDGFL